tara:strand:+ start:388 stop:2091 length:1704 start_codon:yes stop_codon:yes gene_type:complete
MLSLKKLINLLNKKQKKEAAFLLFLIFIATIIEMLGIGIILPVLTVFFEPDNLNNNDFNTILKYISILGFESIHIALISALLFIHIFKFFYLSYVSWKQSDFVWNFQSNLASRLYRVYLNQKYEFFFNRNSSELLRNTSGETGQLAASVMALLNLINETLVIIGISLLLLIFEPVMATASILIGALAALLYYYIIRNRLVNWGKKRQYHEGQKIKIFQEGIGAIKDIKLIGKEDNIIKSFSYHAYQSTNMSKYNSLLQSIPRLWLELIAVIFLFIFILFVFNEGDSINSLIPILGLFAASAFRLMPSINRILYSLQSLRFANAVVNNIDKELKLDTGGLSKNNKEFYFKDKIELKSINYTYPKSDKLTLIDINFTIKKGQTIGIQGPNGSGKSTLLDILLGLLEPSSGKLLIDNIEINEDLRKWQNMIGYVSQKLYLTDDTLRNNIALGVEYENIDEESINESIKNADLTDLVASFPRGLDTIVGEDGIKLSGGQKQKIVIARALYRKPKILVLDEASSALDFLMERKLIDLITSLKNITIFIVTHRKESLENCDLIVNLDNGKIIK